MDLKSIIDRMYQDIVDSRGNFGDPIETGPYSPFEISLPTTEFELEGVGVGMLCFLLTAIDNGTYDDALTSGTAKQARVVLDKAPFDGVPAIDRALAAFFESERAFVESLHAVYTTVVLRRVREASQQGDTTKSAFDRPTITRAVMPSMWAPTEAAALWAVGLLPSSALPELAMAWLIEGLDSPSMRALAGEGDPIMSEVGPLFTATLEELAVGVPEKIEATLAVLEIYVRSIATGAIDPFDGMTRIDNDFARSDLFPDTKYVGDGLGLERMYTWYREIQDARDGSSLNYYTDIPREQAEARFREHLIEEARIRLEKFEA